MAIFLSPLFQVTPLLSAFSGSIFAVNRKLSPTFIAAPSGDISTDSTGTGGAVTVREQDALTLASSFAPLAVAVMRTGPPGLWANTSPFSLTVAIFLSPLFQLTLLSVAFSGPTRADSFALLPASSVRMSGDTVTLSAQTGMTVTKQGTLVRSPTLAVIYVSPLLMSVTYAVSAFASLLSGDTTATFSFELVQRTWSYSALSGRTVAVSLYVRPSSFMSMDKLFCEISTEVTFTGMTVTVQVSVHCCPSSSVSSVVTVISALPTAIAVTRPFSLTIATSSRLLFQETFLLPASFGFTMASSFRVPPL